MAVVDLSCWIWNNFWPRSNKDLQFQDNRFNRLMEKIIFLYFAVFFGSALPPTSLSHRAHCREHCEILLPQALRVQQDLSQVLRSFRSAQSDLQWRPVTETLERQAQPHSKMLSVRLDRYLICRISLLVMQVKLMIEIYTHHIKHYIATQETKRYTLLLGCTHDNPQRMWSSFISTHSKSSSCFQKTYDLTMLQARSVWQVAWQ